MMTWESMFCTVIYQRGNVGAALTRLLWRECSVYVLAKEKHQPPNKNKTYTEAVRI